MKNRVQLFSLLSIFLIAFSSCTKRIKPSGTITTEVYNLGGYDKVIVSDAINARIKFTSGQEQVTVEANSNLHAYIKTEVIGNSLYIRLKNNVNIRGNYTLNVLVEANDLSALDLSGASKCEIENNWVNSSVSIHASGASQVSGPIVADNCSLDLSGASKVSFSGTATTVKLDFSGASNFDGFSFQCDDLNAHLSGASKAELTVNSTLNLHLSGASTLRYMGQGVIGEIESSGSSSVIHL